MNLKFTLAWKIQKYQRTGSSGSGFREPGL